MTEYIIIAVCAFLAGYFSAKSKKIRINKSGFNKCKKDEISKIMREYENFLNYDGSEQSQKGRYLLMTDEIIKEDSALPQAEPEIETDSEKSMPDSENRVVIPVKFNKEIKELTLEEAANLAQKGMKFELILKDFNTLKELSAKAGKSVTLFLEDMKNAVYCERKAALTEKCGGDTELAEHIISLEKEGVTVSDMGFSELQEFFPQITEKEDLPQEVIEASMLKGTLLLDEYLRYRLAEELRTKEALKKQKHCENISIGSQLNRKGSDNPETTEFLKGLWK